ncbi:FecR family protein [Niabella insulamsoli]|uniref:FecR family protein n=1 Tax=Niabella insulamsoli TaxID=3144874 RepID=UPI0031FC5241
MSRVIFGEATTDEIAQFQDHCAQDPVLQEQYQTLAQLFQTNGSLADAAAISYELQAQNLLKRAEKIQQQNLTRKQAKSHRMKYWVAAASVVVGLLAAWGIWEISRKADAPAPRLAIAAPEGQRKSIKLKDGTVVWLNGGSSLHYINDFNASAREVKLEGEAYFDVVKDASKPFIVHAGKVLIKVLGTAFNVKAYPEDADVTTSLYRGLVSVSRQDEEAQPILLYPHQKLTMPNQLEASGAFVADLAASAMAAKVEFLDSSQTEPERVETSWIYNRLEFRGDDFLTLSHKMQHWFNTKIHFLDEPAKQMRFNGSFQQETLEQALKALQLANSFTYKIENNEVFIYSDP